jgi:polyphosphate kinase
MNSLVDSEMIVALYRASQAGVEVDLLVRGVCCLRPGLPGISEQIRVTAILGRFLEHSRIFYFRNGGNEEVYMGSADLMPRNLDRRVEELVSVEDPGFRAFICHELLPLYLRDVANTSELRPDGTYAHRVAPEGEPPFDVQAHLVAQAECKT